MEFANELIENIKKKNLEKISDKVTGEFSEGSHGMEEFFEAISFGISLETHRKRL